MTTENIRGILVDPATRTVTEVTITGDTRKAMYRLLDCPKIERVRLGYIQGQEQDLWIDEEGILRDWDSQQFFSLKGMSYPIAGKGLMLAGDDTSNTISAHPSVTVERIQGLVRWINAQDVDVPAPTLITFAPDGTPEVTLLAGTARWNYANQP